MRILVVGNPCNTNCLVAYQQRPGHPRRALDAMTRLDHNRAVAALAKKAGVANEAVTCVTIWGNHSNTQYPDFTNAKINGKPATEVITDRAWLESTFVPQCQNRGAGGHREARAVVGVVGGERRDRPRQEPGAAAPRAATG